MVDSADLRKEISAYLGTKRTKILDKFTKEDWKFFKDIELDLNESYFVKGDKTKLLKFEAYYLFICAYRKPLYKNYMLTDYANILSSSNSDDYDDVGVDRELVILYMHDLPTGVGNSVGWLTVTILNKVANRNRQGNKTIILSERSFIPFQDSKEFKVIDLGGAAVASQAAEVAKEVVNENSQGHETKEMGNVTQEIYKM